MNVTLIRGIGTTIVLITAINIFLFGCSSGNSNDTTINGAPVTAPFVNMQNVQLFEGNAGYSLMNFNVRLSTAPQSNVTITFEVVDGTATLGEDYEAVQNTTITIPQGVTTIAIPVKIIGDLIAEDDETLFVNLLSVSGGNATLGAFTQGIGTIGNDDDNLPKVGFASTTYSVLEGAAPQTSIMSFVVILSKILTTDITITYQIDAVSATSVEDYQDITNPTLTIPAGLNQGTIPVTINGDDIVEPHETFQITLLTVTGDPEVKLGAANTLTATGTITNDDGVVLVGIGNASLAEGNSGTTNMLLPITLSSAAINGINISYEVIDGSATTADLDYQAPATTLLSINTGATSGTISIPIIGDTKIETSETFTVNLLSVTGSAALDVSNSSAIGTILNDDSTLTLNDTGITSCVNDIASSAIANCNNNDTLSGLYGQDGHYGLDTTPPNDSNGKAGFNFTKLKSDGTATANNAPQTDYTCVRDNNTGLVWEKKTANTSPASELQNSSHTYTWFSTEALSNGGDQGQQGNSSTCTDLTFCNTEDYIAAINTATLCGIGNWRLPTPTELLSIVVNSLFSPATDTNFFPNMQSAAYWTNTSDAATPAYVWTVNFDIGGLSNTLAKSEAHAIRLVSGGNPMTSGSLTQVNNCNANLPPSTPDQSFSDNGDGTVTDLRTGLMWKQCIEGQSGVGCTTGNPIIFSSLQALADVRELNNNAGFSGFHDWRLPNKNELESLLERSCYGPAINTTMFPNMPPAIGQSAEIKFLTSSQDITSPGGAANLKYWRVKFVDGTVFIETDGVSPPVYFRLVRNQ